MCRPPDATVQFPSTERRGLDFASQLYGQTGGVEGTGDVYGGGNADWEEDVGEDYPSQEEGVWNWPTQLSSSGLPLLSNPHGPVSNTSGYISTAAAQQRRVPKQQRNAALEGHLNFSGTGVPPGTQMPRSEQVPWKLEQLLRGPRPNPHMAGWGNPLQMPPSRVAASMQMSPDQMTSVMAGPSIASAAPSRLASECQMAGARRPPPAMWTNRIDDPETLERWLKNSVNSVNSVNGMPAQFPPRQGQPTGLKGSDALAQLQAMGLPTNESVDVGSQEKQFGMGDVSEQLDDDGTDDDEAVKEKKIRRMLSNRASAKRSRQRRQERLGDLEIQTAKLRVENAAVTRKLNEAMEQMQRYQQENSNLREEVEHLRAEMECVKQQHKLGSPMAGKQESGKASAQSAAAVVGTHKEEMNEAHSQEKWDGHEEKPKCQDWKKTAFNSADSENESAVDVKEIGRPSAAKSVDMAKNNGTMYVQNLSGNEKKAREMAEAEAENKGMASPTSGLTLGSGRSMPAVATSVVPAPLCELDALGLPVLDAAMLEPDVLGKDMELANDEWIESLVHCLED